MLRPFVSGIKPEPVLSGAVESEISALRQEIARLKQELVNVEQL